MGSATTRPPIACAVNLPHTGSSRRTCGSVVTTPSGRNPRRFQRGAPAPGPVGRGGQRGRASGDGCRGEGPVDRRGCRAASAVRSRSGKSASRTPPRRSPTHRRRSAPRWISRQPGSSLHCGQRIGGAAGPGQGPSGVRHAGRSGRWSHRVLPFGLHFDCEH